MDSFNICQAYSQLENDYNVDGWVRERPSNQRRKESIGCQLHRIGFSNPNGWVDIESNKGDNGNDENNDNNEVREVYMCAVLRWNLPISPELMTAMRNFFTAEFLAQYPQTAGVDYKQGR